MWHSGATITRTSEPALSTRNTVPRGPPHILSLEWLARSFLKMSCEFPLDLFVRC